MDINIDLSKLYHPTSKQLLAHQTINDPYVRYLLYGGAKGGGKTVWLCWQSFFFCLRHPGIIGFMGRKKAKHFRESTLETWKRETPQDLYEIKDNNKESVIILPTFKAKINFGGMDSEEAVDKFNSMETGFAGVDQAEELSQDDFAMIDGTLRQKSMPCKFILTANPRPGWMRERLVKNPMPRSKFIQALPGDNPHLSKEYLEALKESLKYRPELLEALLYGNWDKLEGQDIVIPYDVCKKATSVAVAPSGYVIISCDPARFGDDETVIYVWDGYKVIDQYIYGYKDTMETVGRLVFLSKKYNARRIFIDADGMGGPMADRLMELNEPIFPINSAVTSADERYLNLRAEMWFKANEVLMGGQAQIPNDPALTSELSCPRYEFASNGKIKIESKEEIKKPSRLGRSPDRADALVYGLWGLQFEKPLHNPAPFWKYQNDPQLMGIGYGEV